MIITRLYCGLGNQMFQYAAGLSLAYHRQTILKLDVSWYSENKATAPHERYGLNCYNIIEQFATEQELELQRCHQRNIAEDRFGRLLGKIGLKRYSDLLPLGGFHYLQKNFTYDPDFLTLPENCLIDGGFQSEKYFFPISDILRKHFSFRYTPTAEVANLAEQILKSNAVAVHFRRGDFVTNPLYMSTISSLELSYYNNAFNSLKSHVENPKYFIFSDDIEYVRSSGMCPNDSVYVDCISTWHSYDKIRLMSLCKNFIISNSTFAWWGAWLSESSQKIVIYPEPWFKNMPDKDTTDLCPKNWHSISRY